MNTKIVCYLTLDLLLFGKYTEYEVFLHTSHLWKHKDNNKYVTKYINYLGYDKFILTSLKKPSKLPTHLRDHHKDCCQAMCQHLDHKSGSTGIKSGEAVKASLEAVLNVAPPSLQLARLPALEAPTCPNLPPTILCSKVVFTSTTRYGGYLFSDERKNYSLVCLYKLLPAQTYLPPFLAEQCSKVVFNSIHRFSAYLQCPTGRVKFGKIYT